LPDRITLDYALGESGASTGITFDDALASREEAAVPINRDPNARPDPSGRRDFTIHDGQLMLVPRVQGPERANFGASLKNELVEDPETKRRLIAESLFPGDPKGVDRVGVVDGRPVYVDDKGELREVSSALTRLGAAAVANAPEIALATAGSFYASPVIGGAVGAAGGRGWKRVASALLLDEPQTIAENVIDLGTEGALAMGAGLAGKLVAKAPSIGRMPTITAAEIKNAEQARVYIKQSTGVDVDLAQASGDRKLIAIRNYAARYPGKSAEMIQAADEAASGQFDAAASRTLDLVAKATPQETAYTSGINAAQMVIKAAREKVYDTVRPLYEAAYKATPKVEDPEVIGFLKLPYFKEAFKSGQRIAKLEGKELPVTDVQRYTDINKAAATVREQGYSLESLDYLKRGLDDQIERLVDAGRRQEARALQIKRDEFVEKLDEVSGPTYRHARQRYGELIRSDVEPLEGGLVGAIAKIENPRFATRAARIFSDRGISADEIRSTRNAISSAKGGAEAWNGLVRQYIGRTWNEALKESQTGQVTNAAGKLRQALIGTPRDRERTEAMLPDGALRAFNDLMNAAESLASTPIRGSDTAFNQEISSQLKGRAATTFRWLTQPRASVIGAAEQRELDRSVQAVTEAILDPTKRSQLRELKRMAPSTQKAIAFSAILGEQVARHSVASEPDRLPAMIQTDQ
jgi:hypothetical protein